LLSTTESRSDRGQVLVVFALTLVTLLIFAALVYDSGTMLLERRDEQNAADAAALAGARYLPGDTVTAETAARDIATKNGYTSGVSGVAVGVSFPVTGRIEVLISNSKESIFGRIIGQSAWPVSARAVAANQNNVAAPFAMLALDPTGCDALLVSGSGNVIANGNIQVNSDCSDGALHRGGGGSITVTAPGAACSAVGDIKDPGNNMSCTKLEGVLESPDPLGGLPEPTVPATAANPTFVSGSLSDIPNGCPGGPTAATPAAPATCQFTGTYAGTIWRLHPGYYPGGIMLQAGTFYFEPGIYYLGGGGLQIAGVGATALSVDSGGTTLGGGVMIFNGEAEAFSSQCAAGTAPNPSVQCIMPIILNGSTAQIDFLPLDDGSNFDGLVIYQDRDLSVAGGPDLQINGSTSETQVRGTIYVPAGDVQANGSGGQVATVDQVIAYRFLVNGSGGTINILFDTDNVVTFSAAGLVE